MGVTYLLDTHVWLWLNAEVDRVPESTRAVLADPVNRICVSAVSALEVATKVRLGKLSAPGLLEAWARRLTALGAESLDVEAEHALLAGGLDWDHRDPFDRILVAQATLEGMTLVTVDRALTGLPVPRILTW